MKNLKLFELLISSRKQVSFHGLIWLRATAILLLAFFLAGSKVHAAAPSTTWDGGGADANWSTTANWNNDTLIPVATADVTFGTAFTSGTSISLNGDRTVNTLTINSTTSFSLNNNILTLTAGDITRSAVSGTTTINSGIALGGAAAWNITGNLIANGVVDDGAGTVLLTKTGTGTLTLSGNNTFGGGVTLDGGTLVLGHNSAAGSGTLTLTAGTVEGTGGARTIANNLAIDGNITFSGSENLTFTDSFDQNGNRIYTVNNTTEFSGAITGNNNLTKNGTGTMILSGTGANDLNTVTVNAGTLRLSKTAVVNAIDGNLTIGDGTGTDTVQLTAADQIADTSDVTINSSGVFDLNGNSETIASLTGSAGAGVTLGAGTLTVGGDNSSTTYAGTVSGVGGGLTKVGTGTLSLGADNSYSGVTTISGGILRLNSAGALPGGIGTSGGTSALTINGGVLGLGNGDFSRGLGTGSDQVQFTGTGGFAAYSANRNVNLGGASATVTWNSGSFVPTGSALILGAADATATVDFQNSIDFDGAARTVNVLDGSATVDAILSGTLTGTGSSGLTKTGAGTLVLTGNNDYAGVTTISTGAGTLQIGNGGTSGTLGVGNTVNNSALIFNRSDGVTYGGAISGTGTLTKQGAGTLELSGSSANTYSGLTTVSAGTLLLNKTAGFNAIGGDLTIGAGTVQLAANDQIANTSDVIINNSAGVLNLNGNSDTINTLDLSAAGSVTIGAGTLTLVSTLTMTGGSISSTGPGKLVLGGTLTGDGNTTATISGNLDLGGVTRTFNVNNGTDPSGIDMTISAIISNGALTKAGGGGGDGTLTLSGANTFVGLTTISSGALRAANSTALGTIAGGVSVASGAALELDGTLGNLVIGAEALSLNGAGISTGGALRNIAGNNSYAGVITLGSAARINSDAGTLTIDSAGIITGATFGLTVGGAGNVTISDAINTTTGTLTKDGTGTLTLDQANGYTGATAVNQGVLNVRNSTGVGTTAGGVTVVSGAALELQNNITVGAEALSLSGTGVSSGGALRNVSGDNSWGGTITLADVTGVHRINSDSGTLTIGGGITETGGNNKDLTFGGSGDVTANGIISGTAGDLRVFKDGSGTLTLSGVNTYDGTTTISAGTLKAGNAAALGATTAGTTVSATGAALDLNGQTIGLEAVTINGTGISSGGALINSSGTAASLSGGVALGSASSIGGSGDTTLSGAITGGFGLTKVGAGTVTLGANNSAYANAITIDAGTLKAGNAGALGTTAAGTTVSGTGAALDLNGQTIGAEAVTINGTGISSGGALINSSGSAASLSGGVTLGSASSIVASGNMTLSGGINGAGNALTIGGAGNVTVNTAGISGSGTSLTKTGGGTLALNVASAYTGGTTLSQGNLQLGNDNALGGSTSGFTFGGGVLDANNKSFNIGALSLTGDSTLNLVNDANNSSMTFSSGTWTAGILTIDNWAGTPGLAGSDDRIFITTDPTGDPDFLAHIYFDLGGGDIRFAEWLSGSQELVAGVNAVPEPINVALGVFGVVFVGLGVARRLRPGKS